MPQTPSDNEVRTFVVLGLLGPLGAVFAGFFIDAATSQDPDEADEAPDSTDQLWNGALLDDLGDVNTSEDFLPKSDDFSDPNDGDLTFDAIATQDILRENPGDDWVHGGEGSDLLGGRDGDDQIGGGYGSDWIHGGNGADTLAGDPGSDDLKGNKGPDQIESDAGNDTLSGHAS